MMPPTLEQVLAQRHKVSKDIVNVDEPVHKLVIFKLAGQCFAFYGQSIREILAQADVFFVPGSPPSLEGVINVRGDIESVIRPHSMLHLPEDRIDQNSPILLGHVGTIGSGIRVDRIVDVVDITQSSIGSPPAALPEHMRSLVLGVLMFRELPVALLDIDKMFTDYTRELV